MPPLTTRYVLWGLTFTGYFLILWPLAYLNHRLLAREFSSGAGAR